MSLCYWWGDNSIPEIARRREKKEAERRRQAEEQERRTQKKEAERLRQAEEQERRTQEAYYSALVHTVETSLNAFEIMPGYLIEAEKVLDQAERDFNEGAFSPFWSLIENATVQLGAFDNDVREITTQSKKYENLTENYKGTSPRFPIVVDSVRNMAAANTTADRLKSIVRKAQCNFQFATIYEQRKTNQFLVAGFTTLAQALDGMGQRIASSIGDLGSNISEMSAVMESSLGAIAEQLLAVNESLTESINATNLSLIESINALHDTTKTAASESKERADRDWEALDNIQRHRKPSGSRPLDIGTEAVK